MTFALVCLCVQQLRPGFILLCSFGPAALKIPHPCCKLPILHFFLLIAIDCLALKVSYALEQVVLIAKSVTKFYGFMQS